MNHANAMTEPPFQLKVAKAVTKKTEKLECTALLREVVEKRRVYEAIWNNRETIVKVFSDKLKAGYHLKREWRGLHLLKARGLNSPRPLFTGQLDDASLVLVTEKIADSKTAIQVISAAEDNSEKTDLMLRLCRELAKQNNKGVIQKDLHLGNFLVTHQKIYALDAGQMIFLRHPLSRKNSIRQLAVLACSFDNEDNESLEEIYCEYAHARGWGINDSDRKILKKQLQKHKNSIIKKSLKKCLRTSKRFLKVKSRDYRAVFDKQFCVSTEPLDFIKQIDSLMENGQILKDGNTCKVSRMTVNAKDVVIKRYNHKGLIHSLRHTIKGSRARRGWLNAHRLDMLKIKVPKPLAFIEKLNGSLVWCSYLVTEFVPAQTLHNFLQNSKTKGKKYLDTKGQILKVLDILGRNKISHNDLKHSNILISNNGPVLTDFDGIRNHRCNLMYEIRRKKDISRISKNWPELQAAQTAPITNPP